MAEDARFAGSLEEHAGQVQPDETRAAAQARDAALIQEVIDHFALAEQVESKQRAQEDEDLEFEGEEMWTDAARASRSEHIDEATGRRVPARPVISVNLVEQRAQAIVTEARQARLGISVQPKAGLATTKQAGYYKGLIRSIQADSGASEVRLWALERGAKCGRGAYRINVEFSNDGDFDLDLVIARILNQATVYWDVYAGEADRRDAEWCIVTDWLSEAQRLRRWPTKPLVPSAGAFESSDHPWFAIDDEKQKSVRIAEYYKVVFDEHLLAFTPHTGAVPLESLPVPLQEMVRGEAPGTRLRRVLRRRVVQAIVDGTQVLERHVWLGRYIPIITVTGKEYNIKGKRSWKGVVTNVKDLNRGYNVAISSAVEAAGSMPRAPYLMYAGQDEGFEEMWDDSPIKAYTRLYINLLEVDGKPVPLPQRQIQEPALQGALLLARVLKDDIGSQTGVVDPALRAVNPYERSGKAIEALQRQGAAGTSNYLDNLATISMVQEGRTLIDLIPKVYDRRGRVIAVMDGETEEESAIILKVPFVRGRDGLPVPVPCPACQGRGQVRPPRTFRAPFPQAQTCPACEGDRMATRQTMAETFEGQAVEYVDLADGQFKVTVAVGRNYQTKQDEAMGAMTQLATSAPALVPVYADLWVRAMGFSGANEIADRLKRTNPAVAEEKGASTLPPEIMARMQALELEHQAAMAELEKATEALRTDAVKMAGQKELQAMKAEAAEALEHLKQQGEYLTRDFDRRTTQELEVLRSDLEAMRQESEQRHELLLQLLQEQGAQDIERHKASLHEAAAAVAERELPS